MSQLWRSFTPKHLITLKIGTNLLVEAWHCAFGFSEALYQSSSKLLGLKQFLVVDTRLYT